jgi:hypothetical protein
MPIDTEDLCYHVKVKNKGLIVQIVLDIVRVLSKCFGPCCSYHDPHWQSPSTAASLQQPLSSSLSPAASLQQPLSSSLSLTHILILTASLFRADRIKGFYAPSNSDRMTLDKTPKPGIRHPHPVVMLWQI